MGGGGDSQIWLQQLCGLKQKRILSAVNAADLDGLIRFPVAWDMRMNDVRARPTNSGPRSGWPVGREVIDS
jgi:hypothetical protein